MNNGNYCGMEFLFVFWEAFNTQRQKDEFFFWLALLYSMLASADRFRSILAACCYGLMGCIFTCYT